jgi:hypothetical protein
MKHLDVSNHTTAMGWKDAPAAGISRAMLRSGRTSANSPVMSPRPCDGMARFLMTVPAGVR